MKFKALIISLLAGAAIYVGMMLAGDVGAISGQIKTLSLFAWSTILTLSLLNYFLRFYRWGLYTQVVSDVHIPVWRHLLIYLSGFALTTTPGKAGEMIRSLYLEPYGVRYAKSIGCFIVERFTDVLTISLLSLLIIWAFEQYRWVVALMCVAAIVVVPLIRNEGLWAFVTRKVQNLPEKLANTLSQPLKVLPTVTSLMSLKQLYIGIAIGLVAWGAEGYAFYFILDCLDIDIAIPVAIGIYAVAVLIGALSFLPGGLGSTEAVMFISLVSMGADKNSALAATLICRAATLWFAVLIGVLSVSTLSLLKMSKRSLVHHTAR